MRVKLTISYDGSKFRGFQAQRDGTATVANTLESAFASLGIKEKFNASGRTDSGVHALNQVVDIKLPPYWSDLMKLKIMLNRRLHPSIHIKSIDKVKDSFHARFSAKKRQYRYIIKQSKKSRSQFKPFNFFKYNHTKKGISIWIFLLLRLGVILQLHFSLLVALCL